jgi:hypothetical protein
MASRSMDFNPSTKSSIDVRSACAISEKHSS